jgi:hypothetical protein
MFPLRLCASAGSASNKKAALAAKIALKKPTNNVDKKSKQQTGQDHSSNRKIKAKMLLFHPDISRQSSDPVKLIVQKVDQDPDDNDHQAKEHDIFSCILIHFCNLQTVDRTIIR